MSRHGPGTRELDVQVTAAARVAPRVARDLKRHLASAQRMLRSPLQEMSIALVGDARMSQLHEQFMGVAGPTDVLTFELDHDARGRVTSGEVVVCVPQARREARKRGIDLQLELLLYALHGMLHLCGFDDRTERGFRTMHRREDDILTRLGFGPVFALSSPTPVRRGGRQRRRERGT